MYNQQQQLPVDPMNQMFQFVQMQSPDHPPFVPPISTDQQLQQYIPRITALTINEIQSKATLNPLRMFMFNLYAQNGFQNQQFGELIARIVDYVILVFYIYRRTNDLNQAVQNAVTTMVEMVTASQAYFYPQLMQLLDPQTQQFVQQSINDYQQVGNEIKGRQQTGQWPGMQPQQSNFGFQGNQGVGYGNQMGGMPSAMQNRFGGGSSFSQGGLNQPGGTSFFRNSDRLQPQPSTMSDMGGAGASRWNNPPPASTTSSNNTAPANTTAEAPLQQPFTSRSNTMDNQQQTAPATEAPPVVPEVSVFETKHNPSRTKGTTWYLPAYNPATHELVLQVLPDGTTSPKLNPRNPMLDYDRHKLPSAFGPIPHNLRLGDSANVMKRLQEGVKELNGEKPEEQEGETYQPTAYVRKTIGEHTSLSEAWMDASLTRMASNETNGNPDIFRMYFRIANPIIGEKDETAQLREYADTATYVDLAKKLHDSVNDTSPILWEEVNKKMTAVINRILKQNLSLPELSIDSFEADIGELIAYVEKTWDVGVRDALLKEQDQHISDALGTLDDDSAQQMTEHLLDGREYGEHKPAITYLTNDVSLTLLNCRSYELEIELVPGMACRLTRNFSPIMLDLVANIFKEEGEVGTVERHLIRTNDGRVMEASRGYLASNNEGDAYLLTVIE